jgi:MFS family permease
MTIFGEPFAGIGNHRGVTVWPFTLATTCEIDDDMSVRTQSSQSLDPPSEKCFPRPRSLRRQLDRALGGGARRTVIIVLASVLALDSADQGAISATAGQLQSAFHIGTTDIGLLLTITQLVGAAFALPFGVLADRVTRTRLLVAAIGLWAVAMVASGCASTYLVLMLTRLSLGAVTAVAYPAIASLVGDFFLPTERGRIYGFVLSGELVGAGLGILIAGEVASLFGSWRPAFFALALPAIGVMWLVRRLPEPARGGASRMLPGAEHIISAQMAARDESVPAGAEGPNGRQEVQVEPSLAPSVVHEKGIEPDPSLVLEDDPGQMSVWAAVRYVLRIRTNVVVIVSSALGYYFFAGVRGFGVEFAQYHYGLSQATASSLLLVIGIGALAGVLVGGRAADFLLRRGRVDARIVVPAAAFCMAAVLFAPALAFGTIVFAIPVLIVGNFFQSASNPALDAARLDIMVPRLWGRAEAVRSTVRTALQAVAPLVFGAVAQYAFGGRHRGLEDTFLVMLVPLLASGLILLAARRTYGTDVATADASSRELTQVDDRDVSTSLSPSTR